MDVYGGSILAHDLGCSTNKHSIHSMITKFEGPCELPKILILQAMGLQVECKLKVILGHLWFLDQSHDLCITSLGSSSSSVKWL